MNLCKSCNLPCCCCSRCDCCYCCCYPPCPPPVKASFTAVKRDKYSEKTLAGAIFTLYKDGSTVAVVTSDSNGALTFSDLVPGQYELVETMSPYGYQENYARYTVEVDADGMVTIDGQPAEGHIFYNLPLAYRLSFYKTDAETGLPLAGAVFTLSNGMRATSDADGFVMFNGLVPGTYTLTESEAPEGYESNSEIYTVVVGRDGSIIINGIAMEEFSVENTTQCRPSPRPVISSIVECDRFITGTGVPGAVIEVTLPDGIRITTTVNESGIWLVPVLAGSILYAGQTVYATQTLVGYCVSDTASFQVQPCV